MRMEEAKKRFNQSRYEKKTLCSCAAKWPKLEEYVKNWIIDHRNAVGLLNFLIA